MSELIKGLVHIRDALSLIAFLSLVPLVAFRTRKVPELFFGMLRDKLTRQQFSALLNRFMILVFIAFLTLVSLAVLAQVLNYLTEPGGLTIDDLRSELARLNNPDDQKIRAEAQYNLALALLDRQDLDGAIASLEKSIAAIPTLTAQEMVTYLYRQKRDFERESRAWERAVKTAREKGNRLAMVRLDRISSPRGVPTAEGPRDLIGDRTPLPDAGDRFESATEMRPGLYECTLKGGCFSWWYTLALKAGQGLVIRLRSPPSGGLAGAGVYGTNGQFHAQAGDGVGTMRGNAGPMSTIHEVEWTARSTGRHFIRIDADPGTVFRFDIR